MIETNILLATQYLEQQYSKAKDIGFNREEAFQSILWGHIATVFRYKTNYSVASWLIICNLLTFAIEHTYLWIILTKSLLFSWLLVSHSPQKFLPFQNLIFLDSCLYPTGCC